MKAAFLSACILASSLTAFAQSGITNNPNLFDDTTSTASFVTWWTGGGVPNPTITWDATLDAANNPSSGSVRYEVLFVGAAEEQFATWFSLANRWGWDAGTMIDGTIYTNLAFDIKVDPASAVTPGNNYGWLEVALVVKPVPSDPNSWDRTNERGFDIPLSATTWTRINIPINITSPNLDKVVGFSVRMWSNGNHNKSLIFNLDNFGIQKPEGNIVIPPPTLSIEKPAPGLSLVASSTGQWDRQEIRTVGTNYSWVGASGPVSYSFDVSKHADNAHPGFQLFMTLVPGTPDPNRGDSDWHETNVVLWSIYNNADGSAWSELRYKTNAPDSNGHLFDTGSLGGVWNPTCAGTWTITFLQDTNVTVTTPNGGTLAAVLPPEVVDIFTSASTNMQINIGIMPGDPARVGQTTILTGAKITGTPLEANVNSSFLGQAPDPAIWKTIASANGVQSPPADAAYWVNWTMPANGFELQTKTTLDPGTWVSSTKVGAVWGSSTHVLFLQSELPGPNSGYFRLLKRTATKLQILLPGETSAPGTATGKTGTPIPPLWGIEFNITVNAVDNDWNIVRSVFDAIAITSDESFATLPGTNPTLVGGTATVPITFNQWPGPWTLTATDVTDPAKTESTVSVTVLEK